MRVVLFALVAATALYAAEARCPNSCSGHGTCGTNDKCTCYQRLDDTGSAVAAWDGADCSRRTCPKSESFNIVSGSAHADEECSGNGLCDTSSGECSCFAGYEGRACQRTTCPDDCSGHGVCQSIKKFYEDVNNDDVSYINAWDADHNFGCKCDPGYRGPDCSLRECYSGADPLNGEGGTEGRECSGRGVCDYSSGVCTCFSGYFGENCGTQTALV